MPMIVEMTWLDKEQIVSHNRSTIFQSRKYFVIEPAFSNFFSNLFNRIHFSRIGWDIEKDNIIRQI